MFKLGQEVEHVLYDKTHLVAAYQGGADVLLVAQDVDSLVGSVLVAFFFGVACSLAQLHTFDDYLCEECGLVGSIAADGVKLYAHAVSLTPFKEVALEVVLLLGHGFGLDKAFFDKVVNKLIAASVALVQVNGSYQCFKGIAVDMAVVRLGVTVVLDKVVQPDLEGQAVECFALYQFAARGGEEAFAGVGKAMEHDVADHGFDDGIA